MAAQAAPAFEGRLDARHHHALRPSEQTHSTARRRPGARDRAIWFCDFGHAIFRVGSIPSTDTDHALYPRSRSTRSTTSPSLLDPGDSTPRATLWPGANDAGPSRSRRSEDPDVHAVPACPPGANPQYTQESMDEPDLRAPPTKQRCGRTIVDEHAFRRLDPDEGTWESFGPFYYPNHERERSTRTGCRPTRPTVSGPRLRRANRSPTWTRPASVHDHPYSHEGFEAAARPRGPTHRFAVVCRVRREPNRVDRHPDAQRADHRVQTADAVGLALRCGRRQERRDLDRQFNAH